MTWEVDYREPQDVVEMLERSSGEEVVRVNLDVGDYRHGEVGFERKSLDFLKFDDVLAKASELLKFYEKAFLVVDVPLEELVVEAQARGRRYLSGLFGTIGTLAAMGVPPIFAGSRSNMVEVMVAIARKAGTQRELLLRPIKTRPVSMDDWRINVLLGLPNVSVKRARALLTHFGSIRKLANASVSEIMRVEGIGEKIAKQIHEIMWGKYGGMDRGVQPLKR